MPKLLVHISFLFLTLTGLSGLWMRMISLEPRLLFTQYDYFLHAHSHMAVLGWTFLAVYCIFLALIWRNLQQKKQAIMIGLGTFVITVCMFIAFFFQGYALYSIIFSTAHIGMEYWLVVFMYKQLKLQQDIPHYSGLFIKGALIALVFSTIGPFALGGLASTGLKDSPFFDMAIYFYLHFQYNGWLYLALIGLFLWILHRKGITLNKSWMTSSFWIYMVSLIPGYILSVLWYDFGWIGIVLAVFGALGQFTGIILFFIALFKERSKLVSVFSQHILISLLFIFMLLGIKSMMEFGLLYEPLATMVFETRSVVIGYLHLTFLGFISIFLITQYQITGILDESKNSVLYGVGMFIIGFSLNEIILFISGLLTWLGQPFSFQNGLLAIASAILLGGIIILWSSVEGKKAI